MASRRAPAGDDTARIIRKSDRRERQPEVDQIEELVRIVGEADASEAATAHQADERASHPFEPSLDRRWRRGGDFRARPVSGSAPDVA